MDTSSNIIDYMYLVNPNRLDRIKQKKENTIILNEEIHFYRKRIFSLTKDYLKGKSRDRDLDKMWEIYAKACVDYFKFNSLSLGITTFLFVFTFVFVDFNLI